MRGVFFIMISMIVFFSSASALQAQSLDELPGSNPITIRSIPPYPQPGQEVSISIDSFSSDLNRARTIWTVDGKVVKDTTGMRQFKILAGKGGSVTVIDVKIFTLEGAEISRKITLQPADIDLMWQAKSYTPLFYQGKALHSNNGEITVVAIPHLYENGVEIDPKKLVYTWKAGNNTLHTASGYGKNKLDLKGGLIPRTDKISLTVASVNNSVIGTGSINLVPYKPIVRIYEDNPLYGPLYNHALGNDYTLTKKEIQLRAVPYFFSVNDLHRSGSISMNWRINNTPTNTVGDSIIIRQPENTQGSSQVSMYASNASKLFQTSDKTITVRFDESR